MFQKTALLPSSAKKSLTYWTTYINIFSVTGHHWNTHKCR